MPSLSNDEHFIRVKKLFDDSVANRNSEIDLLEKKLTDKYDKQFEILNEKVTLLTEANERLLKRNLQLEEENKVLRKNTAIPSTSTSPPVAPDAPALAVPAEDISLLNAEQPDSGKKYIDILVLSDSIFRHVGSPCPKEEQRKIRGRADPEFQQICILPIRSSFSIGGTNILKVVMPGARAGALQLEASLIAKEFDFGEIILHCGANYVPSVRRHGRRFHLVSPREAINEICGLVDSLGALFTGMITYSMTLPQANCLDYIDDINGINDAVVRYCTTQGLDYMRCAAYERSEDGSLDNELFAADGIHCGRKGIEALYKTLVAHLKVNFMYE